MSLLLHERSHRVVCGIIEWRGISVRVRYEETRSFTNGKESPWQEARIELSRADPGDPPLPFAQHGSCSQVTDPDHVEDAGGLERYIVARE